ncbi:MAG: Gfo/Idh/MocA family protein, partial [bacterium]
MDKVRFGIVGCGVIGPTHAEAIGNIDIAELKAVCDIVPEKAKTLGEKYGVDWYTDYEEMLARQDIDVVSICVPSGLHSDLGVKAAKAGKHVLVEKPIDITLEKADTLIETCKKTGVKLSVISQHRFDKGIKELKSAIDSGRIGRLVMADAYVKWWRPQEYYDSAGWRGTWTLDGGGALMNQSVHFVDQLLYLAGPVKEVTAYCGTLAHKIEVEDVAIAIIKYKNGALGVIQGSTACYPGFKERLEFHGTNGSIIVEGPFVRDWMIMGEEKKESITQGATGASDPKAIFILGHTAQIRDMAEAVLYNRTPSITGEDGRRAIQFILA